MWEYYWEEQTRQRECQEASQFRRIATESILALLTDLTIPDQYQLALDSLAALKDNHISRLDDFHRSPYYGRHRCIEDAFVSLRLSLLNAYKLKPVPQPETAPDPAPEPPRRSFKEILEEYTNENETYLGDIVEGDES
jgi:hypothetical protein